MEEDTQQETSRYNEASLQIMRLHELWLRAEHFANAGLLTKWRFILDSVWRELYPDILKMSDCKKIKEKNMEIKKLIHTAQNKNKLYYFLHKEHEFLKEIQNKAGKGGSYESTTEQDMD